MKQKKAIKNIKYCANDQWAFVNSYIDGDKSVRPQLLDAQDMFDTVYSESQDNIYDDGWVSFGTGASSYLKDTRFCGKKFLQTVTLFYVAKLMYEIMDEVEATTKERNEVLKTLLKIKSDVLGSSEEISASDLGKIFHVDMSDGNKAICELAALMNKTVKTTKNSENWIYVSTEEMKVIRDFFITHQEFFVLGFTTGKCKTQVSAPRAKFILNSGANPYIWCVE